MTEKLRNNRRNMQQTSDKERRLSNVANSVSGFYRDGTVSEHSNLSRTHESNFAYHIGD